jgi:hypothetical protein
MSMSVTIDTGTNKKQFLVLDPDAPAGQVRIELHDSAPSPVVVPTDWTVIPRIGLSPSPAEQDRWHTDLPGADHARVFYGPDDAAPSFKDKTLRFLVDRGINPSVSTKRPSTAAELVAEFDGIPDDVSYERIHHHERVADGGADEQAKAYKLIREVADDHPKRAQITIKTVLELYGARFKRLDWRAFVLPQYADTLSWDCYWGEELAWEDPYSLLGLPASSAAEFGMPWDLSELGASTTRPRRGQWIANVVDAAAFHGCHAVGLWCSKRTFKGKPLDYRPVDAATQDVYRALLGMNTTHAWPADLKRDRTS